MTRNSDIQTRLRDDIISGHLNFGDRLRIDELATRYGVSHMPVREALRVLHGEGLIVTEQNRGARVRLMHPGFVEDLFDIRAAIETMLARRAAARRTEAHIGDLRRTQDRLENLIEAGAIAEVAPVNRAFHVVINDAAGNPGAMSLVEGQWPLVAALWQKFGNGEGLQSVVDDHRHLIFAIERRDADGAATLMGAHIEKAKQNLMARMADHSTIPEHGAAGGGSADLRALSGPR